MWKVKSFFMPSVNYYCMQVKHTSPKALYKFLIRQCQKLPDDGPRKYYIHSVRQSFKQHVYETDPNRIKQIIGRAYEDAGWILKKYLGKQS